MLVGMVQPLPQCMYKVKINLATGTWTIQGTVPSVNAEATYRVWLAKILLLGEEFRSSCLNRLSLSMMVLVTVQSEY